MAEPNFFDVSIQVTRLLAESTNQSSTMSRILALLCKELDWEIALLWMVNDRRIQLELAADFPVGEARYHQFIEVSRARRFSLGEGLPGKAWLTRSAQVFDSQTTVVNFPRISVAKAENINTGIAFPVQSPEGVLGIIELFAENKQIGQRDIQSLEALGVQMGVFLERARIKAELVELDSHFLHVAESASDAILTIDTESTILYCNAAVEKVFGYKPEELVGKNLCEVIPPELRERHNAGMKRYLASGEKRIPWTGVDLPALMKNGERRMTTISFAEFVRGGKRIFTGFARTKPAEKLSLVSNARS